MLNILFRWLLCCSGFLSVHSALALPLSDTLSVSSNFETQTLSIELATATKNKATFLSKIKHPQYVDFLSELLTLSIEQLKRSYTQTLQVLKKVQTRLCHVSENTFRQILLTFTNQFLIYLNSTSLK